MSENDRPLPVADQDSEAYWEAARRGELLVQRCDACGAHQLYPRALCITCGADAPGWIVASGRGTVYSYTVNHRSPGRWASDRTPYVVALVDLEEGPRMMANIDADPAEVEIGRPVVAWFEEIAPGVVLPQFRLAEAADNRSSRQ
jgi:uncharacterized protein